MRFNYLGAAAILLAVCSLAVAAPAPAPQVEARSLLSSWDIVGWWRTWWDWFNKFHGDDLNLPCLAPIVRKEWRQLSTTQKSNYIKAVKCLAKKPSVAKITIQGAVSRFDDFHGIHSAQTPNIHWVGHFALWHRLMLAEYETALRKECGYTGAQPYWNWLIDTASGLNMTEYPIFDPVTGFGGNGPFIEISEEQNWLGIVGRSGGGCVQDGPFTEDKFTINLGPTTDYNVTNPHCVTRDFAPYHIETNLVQSVWDEVLEQPDYGSFARRLEGLPSWDMLNVHGGGHFGVGGVLGTIGDAYNSPGDPLFYLHHANLDRLYWKWEKQNLAARLLDVSGPINAFDYDNTIGGNVTLDYEINMAPITGNIKLKDLTNIKGKRLCYDYDS